MSLSAWTQKVHGEDGFAKVLAAMPAHHAAALRDPIAPISWYPTVAVLEAIHTTGRLFGPADFHDAYGVHSAEYAVNRFYRMVLRFTSPGFVLGRAGTAWRNYHDTGEWALEVGDRHYRGRLRGFGVVDAAYCRVILAYKRRVAELTGGKSIVATHPQCRADGADECLFDIRW
jgi:hypothetical protein